MASAIQPLARPTLEEKAARCCQGACTPFPGITQGARAASHSANRDQGPHSTPRPPQNPTRPHMLAPLRPRTSARKARRLLPSSVSLAAAPSADSRAVPSRQAEVGRSKLRESSRGMKSDRRCSLLSTRSNWETADTEDRHSSSSTRHAMHPQVQSSAQQRTGHHSPSSSSSSPCSHLCQEGVHTLVQHHCDAVLDCPYE